MGGETLAEWSVHTTQYLHSICCGLNMPPFCRFIALQSGHNRREVESEAAKYLCFQALPPQPPPPPKFKGACGVPDNLGLAASVFILKCQISDIPKWIFFERE